MPGLSRRTAAFTGSVIRRMTRISNRTGAAAPLQDAAVTGLHFARRDETLDEALDRLEGLRRKIPPKGGNRP